PAEATSFEAVAGKGVRGTVDGVTYAVGRPEWARERGLELQGGLQDALDEAEARGESVIAPLDERSVLALFTLADKVRPSARAAVEALRAMGVESVMITGDSKAVAATVAGELGIERFHARVLPQEKAGLVRDLREGGPTAFVGDGINDAPALVEAD